MIQVERKMALDQVEREEGVGVNNVISLSGGKDSTAMLHMMLDRGESVHSAVFFDTGWEFPEMAAHIDEVERKTGVKVVRLSPNPDFDEWMYRQRIMARKGEMKGEVWRIGNGWPSPIRRWCTRVKVRAIGKYQRDISGVVPCIGIAADEIHRIKPGNKRYPLIEYGITEADAIKYCRKLGYTWGGLYDIFDRVSCYCCPLQSLKDLRRLRKHRPELWHKLIEWICGNHGTILVSKSMRRPFSSRFDFARKSASSKCGKPHENRNLLHPMRERKQLPEIRRPDAVWILPGIRAETEAERAATRVSCAALVEDSDINAGAGTRR